MSKNLKMNNFEIDKTKLEDLTILKNELTTKIDILVAEHTFYSKQLKEVTDEYFKILGVNKDE